MNIQLDFVELLKLLEKHKVDYMIIGGYAVAFHGHQKQELYLSYERQR